MKRFWNSFAALITLSTCLSMAVSCTDDEVPVKDHYSQVVIYYGCGYNNLSEGMKTNIVNELASGDIPSKDDAKALLALCHNTETPYNYEDMCSPVLIRIYRDNGHAVLDTIQTYPMKTVSASAETMTSVLNEIKEKYKSDSYGLIFSSHASGWLPVGYRSPSSEKITSSINSVGAQYRGSASNSTEIDIFDFANAIPFKMDYIILDCCLCGDVEVAWELRNVCDRIVFSPTEVLSGGYDYNNMAKRLFSSPANLEGICKDHYEKYQYATTTLVDCSEIEGVAVAMSKILTAHREDFNGIIGTDVVSRKVQKYFYEYPYYIYFYDLRDIAVKINATEEELSELDAALKKFVVLEKHTSSFLNGLRLTNVCGVSMYIPHKDWSKLNNYYRGLGWNNQVKVVDN